MTFDFNRYQLELSAARQTTLDLSFANIIFDEAKHPRLHGKFAASAADHQAVMGLGQHQSHQLGNGYTITHHIGDGTPYAKHGTGRFVVKDKKGVMRSDAHYSDSGVASAGNPAYTKAERAAHAIAIAQAHGEGGSTNVERQAATEHVRNAFKPPTSAGAPSTTTAKPRKIKAGNVPVGTRVYHPGHGVHVTRVPTSGSVLPTFKSDVTGHVFETHPTTVLHESKTGAAPSEPIKHYADGRIVVTELPNGKATMHDTKTNQTYTHASPAGAHRQAQTMHELISAHSPPAPTPKPTDHYPSPTEIQGVKDLKTYNPSGAPAVKVGDKFQTPHTGERKVTAIWRKEGHGVVVNHVGANGDRRQELYHDIKHHLGDQGTPATHAFHAAAPDVAHELRTRSEFWKKNAIYESDKQLGKELGEHADAVDQAARSKTLLDPKQAAKISRHLSGMAYADAQSSKPNAEVQKRLKGLGKTVRDAHKG